MREKGEATSPQYFFKSLRLINPSGLSLCQAGDDRILPKGAATVCCMNINMRTIKNKDKLNLMPRIKK